MGDYLTLARPYAVALFHECNGDDKRLSAWHQVLEALSMATAHSPLLAIARNPRVSAQHLHELIMDFLRQSAADPVQCLGATLHHFLSLILASKRLNTLADMLTLFDALVDQRAGVTKVDVSSAFPLSDADAQALKANLSQRLDSRVEIASQTVDKSLLGGVLVRGRNQDFVLDASLRQRLNQLNHRLNSFNS